MQTKRLEEQDQRGHLLEREAMSAGEEWLSGPLYTKFTLLLTVRKCSHEYNLFKFFNQ
jgi:hypothetical protein